MKFTKLRGDSPDSQLEGKKSAVLSQQLLGLVEFQRGSDISDLCSRTCERDDSHLHTSVSRFFFESL